METRRTATQRKGRDARSGVSGVGGRAGVTRFGRLGGVWWLLALVSTLLFLSSAGAEMYRWADDAGKVHFGDRPPVEAQVEEVSVRINTYTAPTIEPLSPIEHAATLSRGSRVVMYSASWCGVCKRARAYFQQNKIPFTEYDVETNEKGKRDYKALHGRGVPIILVGKQRMNGFSAGSFEAMYRGS